MVVRDSFESFRHEESVMHVLRWVGLVVVLLGCASAGPDAGADRTAVDVELLVFSGRANPQWELTDAEVRELVRRVTDLSPGPPPAPPPGLGYSGFRITAQGTLAELPGPLTVYRGVRLDRPGSSATYRDDRGLETWLLALARQRGHRELLDAVGQ